MLLHLRAGRPRRLRVVCGVMCVRGGPGPQEPELHAVRQPAEGRGEQVGALPSPFDINRVEGGEGDHPALIGVTGELLAGKEKGQRFDRAGESQGELMPEMGVIYDIYIKQM